MIAALFVQKNGVYYGLPDVDPWDEARDARKYAGPWPVVAHPPCARWCRLAGLVEARWGHKRGDDGGCFESALRSVRTHGGVLEHPAWSDAFPAFSLGTPPPRALAAHTLWWLDDRALTGRLRTRSPKGHVVVRTRCTAAAVGLARGRRRRGRVVMLRARRRHIQSRQQTKTYFARGVAHADPVSRRPNQHRKRSEQMTKPKTAPPSSEAIKAATAWSNLHVWDIDNVGLAFAMESYAAARVEEAVRAERERVETARIALQELLIGTDYLKVTIAVSCTAGTRGTARSRPRRRSSRTTSSRPRPIK